MAKLVIRHELVALGLLGHLVGRSAGRLPSMPQPLVSVGDDLKAEDPTNETSIEELKEWCRRVLDFTHGIG